MHDWLSFGRMGSMGLNRFGLDLVFRGNLEKKMKMMKTRAPREIFFKPIEGSPDFRKNKINWSMEHSLGL